MMKKYRVEFYHASRNASLKRDCVEVEATNARKAWAIIVEKLQNNNENFEYISVKEIKETEKPKKTYLVKYEHGDRHVRERERVEIKASSEEEAERIVYTKSYSEHDEFCHILSVEEIKKQARGCHDINHSPEFGGDPRG